MQESINNYLADYPYLDGYSPSKIDVKVYQTFQDLNADLINYPHLHRWYKHIASYSGQEQSAFRTEEGKILPQCVRKMHENCNRSKQVNCILLEIKLL